MSLHDRYDVIVVGAEAMLAVKRVWLPLRWGKEQRFLLSV